MDSINLIIFTHGPEIFHKLSNNKLPLMLTETLYKMSGFVVKAEVMVTPKLTSNVSLLLPESGACFEV